MKLSLKQNAVIYCMQNGWSLITDRDNNYVVCYNKTHQFQFSLTIFWNLYKKGLIYQQINPPFEYVLTGEGKEVKTAKIDFTTPTSVKK